ncbi:hypothetical protein [Sphingosinithalassobacter sp. CS137]|uniref:hypothetical protein n=1 Tax=Sphingosinithalassobacter sp. CS137 TaxID=2762748 RepID=UPI00165E274D|nr:hypothetical protein [Sphingosinithalassobacter sp. CS137]
MLDKKQIKSASKKFGFHASGNFLIGARSEDILSGIAIDAAPSATYIWTFILPVFDEISFLHMTLGERVADLSTFEGPLDGIFNEYRRIISPIRQAIQLVSYLDFKKIKGEYADWTRLICLVRSSNFDQANEFLDVAEGCFGSRAISDKLIKLREAQSSGGWPAVQDLLKEWSESTDKLLNKVPLEL